jgi:hypothetical protein
MQELNLLIVLSENKTIGNLTEFLADSEILIIDVPPKLVVRNGKLCF